MARSIFDKLIGRHYCPACEKAAGFRVSHSFNRDMIRWYKPVHPRFFCNSCNAQVQGCLKPGIWVALTILVIFVISALIILSAFTENEALSATEIQIIGFFLLTSLTLLGSYIVQEFLYYKVV